MEELFDRQRKDGTNLHTDRSKDVRYSGRPTTPPARQSQWGLGMDLGSDFGPREQGSRDGHASASRNGGGSKGKEKEKDSGAWSDDMLDDSFDIGLETSRDELDMISPEKSRSSNAPSKSWSHASNRLKAAREEDAKSILVDNKSHEIHPMFPPKSLPNFKKKTKADLDSNSSAKPSHAALVDGQTYNFPAEPPTEPAVSHAVSQRRPPPLGTSRGTRGVPNTRGSNLSKPFKVPSAAVSSSAEPGPSSRTPSSVIQPLIDSMNGRKNLRSEPLQVRNENEEKRPLAPRKFPLDLDLDDSDRSHEKTPRPPARTAAGDLKVDKPLDSFSLPSPLSEQTPQPKVPPRPKPRPLNRKSRETVSEPIVISSQSDDEMGKRKAAADPRPFPLDDFLSPVKKGATSNPFSKPKTKDTFPSLPPLSSASSSRTKRTGRSQLNARTNKRIVVSSSEDDESSEDELPSKASLRAFPMDTQMLDSLVNSPSPGKRGSEDSGPEDTSRNERKRRRKNSSQSLRALSSENGKEKRVFDSELHFFDPNIDPSTLCPWCDDPLPAAPSPLLLSLIATVRRKSSRDPRPTNPEGLWASPTVYAQVCARHAFEDEHIPMAEANGWPTRIQWSELADRIARRKEQLQAIINDLDEDFLPGRQKPEEKPPEDDVTDNDGAGDEDHEDEELQKARPRKGSVFWKEVVKNVRKEGSKKASGVRGQFSSFEKTQPGYYGELGYVIIHQTIYDLFPPATFEADSTLPLVSGDFIRQVLIPEAALSLIMEDMSLNRHASLKILRESAEYGVAMFPDEGGTNVGENIVRQRAKNRRKEIGEDDTSALEDDRMSESVMSAAGSSSKAKGKRRGRPPKKPQPMPDSSEGEGAVSSRSRSCKPPSSSYVRPKAKLKKTASQGDVQDVIMISDSAESVGATSQPPPSQVPRPRPTRKPKGRPPSSSAPNFPVHDTVNLCESSDFSDALAVESHLSQPHAPTSASEKENVRSDANSDTDIELLQEPPPSSMQSIPEITFNADGSHHVKERSSSMAPSDVEATPKKRVFSRTSSTSSTKAVVSAPSGSMFPLDIARKRSTTGAFVIEKGLKRTALTDDEDWFTNLKNTPDFDDDDMF